MYEGSAARLTDVIRGWRPPVITTSSPVYVGCPPLVSLSFPGSWKLALSRVASAIDIPPGGGACVSTEKGDCGNMGTNINKAGFTPAWPAVLDHSLVVMLRFCLQQKVWRGWIYVAYLNFVLVYVAFIVVVAKGASVRVLGRVGEGWKVIYVSERAQNPLPVTVTSPENFVVAISSSSSTTVGHPQLMNDRPTVGGAQHLPRVPSNVGNNL